MLSWLKNTFGSWGDYAHKFILALCQGSKDSDNADKDADSGDTVDSNSTSDK